MSTEFTQQVIRFIRQIPKGKVATYSQCCPLKPAAFGGGFARMRLSI